MCKEKLPEFVTKFGKAGVPVLFHVPEITSDTFLLMKNCDSLEGRGGDSNVRGRHVA